MKKILIMIFVFCLGGISITTTNSFASALSDASTIGKLSDEISYIFSRFDEFLYNQNINQYFVNTAKIEEITIEDSYKKEIISFNDEQKENFNISTSFTGLKLGDIKDNKFITLVSECDSGTFQIVGYIPSMSSDWMNVEVVNVFLSKSKYEHNYINTNDIDAIDGFLEDILLLMLANNLMNIQEYIDFNPYENVTRGEVVYLLSKCIYEDLSVYTKSSFDDIDDDFDYMKHIEWAKKFGIVNGISDTIFAPYEYITREQLAVILNNYIEYYNLDIWKYERNFADFEEVSNWAVESVNNTIMYTGFTKKDENVYFNPKENVSKIDIYFALEQIINYEKIV